MNPLKSTKSEVITFTKANFHHLCRVCFCNIQPPVINIFSSLVKEEPVVKLINLCIPKQAIDISLPNNICKDCLNILIQFKTFINQFQYADTLLTFVKDQLNNGSDEVKVNNLTRADELCALAKVIERKKDCDNSPSCSRIERNIAKEKVNTKSGILKREQKPAVAMTNLQSRTNLNKTKSKSTDNMYGTRNKPLLSLPLLITCDTCKVDFLNVKIFEMHMRKSHPNNILKCSFCTPTKDFFDAEELKRHKISSHELIECRKCSGLIAKANLDRHNKKIHPQVGIPDGAIAQNICTTNINTNINSNSNEESQCKLHIIKTEYLNKPIPSYTSTKCIHCCSVFTSEEFIAHSVYCKQSTENINKEIPITATAIKPIKKSPMLCILCKDNKPYPSYTHFEQHCSKHHPNTVCCNICQTNTLYSKEAIKLHKINAHGFLICQICQCTVKPEKIEKHMEDCHSTRPVQTLPLFS